MANAIIICLHDWCVRNSIEMPQFSREQSRESRELNDKILTCTNGKKNVLTHAFLVAVHAMLALWLQQIEQY